MSLRKLRESTALQSEGKGTDVSDPKELWRRFDALVKTWGAKINLVGAKDDASRADVLFADAAQLLDEALLPRGARFCDVGAGVGAPAIPVLLQREDLTATLIEPRRNRVAFLRTAIGSLGLVDRCEVLEQRLEAEPPRGAPFDVAISRATFAPDEWLRRAPLLAPRAIVLVGAEPLPEGDRLAERRYALPHAGTPRALGLYAV